MYSCIRTKTGEHPTDRFRFADVDTSELIARMVKLRRLWVGGIGQLVEAQYFVASIEKIEDDRKADEPGSPSDN
jgi:hypothetical protein